MLTRVNTTILHILKLLRDQILNILFTHKKIWRCHSSVTNKKLFVLTQELHTLKVTGQEGDCGPDQGSCSLTGGLHSRSGCALARTPLEDGVPWAGWKQLDTCSEVKSTVPWLCWKSKRSDPHDGQKGEKEEGWLGQAADATQQTVSSTLCPPLATRRALMPTLKYFVILALSNKATQPSSKNKSCNCGW